MHYGLLAALSAGIMFFVTRPARRKLDEFRERKEHLEDARARVRKLTKQINDLKKEVPETKKCPSCVNETNKDAVFCEFCGVNIKEMEETEKEKEI